jgi:hypothetical protein
MVMTSNSPDVYREPTRIAANPVGIRPIPPIPAVLHGCWDFIMPTDPDEPGSQHRLIVTPTTIAEIAPSGERKVATADFVERVSTTSIKGRYSYDDQFGRATLATGLTLEAGETLEKDEGDAGGSSYRRCEEPDGAGERG